MPKTSTAAALAARFELFNSIGAEPPPVKRGPKRMLCMEEEFLLTLMRLGLGLLAEDLAFRFKVSQSLVAQIFQLFCHIFNNIKDIITKFAGVV